MAADDLCYSLPAEAIHADRYPVAGLHDIGEGGLHTGRSWSGERESELIRGAKSGPEKFHGLVQEGEEVGVQVTQDGRGQRSDDTGVEVTGTRAQQKAGRRAKFAQRLRFQGHFGFSVREDRVTPSDSRCYIRIGKVANEVAGRLAVYADQFDLARDEPFGRLRASLSKDQEQC